MVSKHEKEVWNILDYQKIKSTNEILGELMKRTNKTINWFLVYKILKNLEESSKVERLISKGGLFWRKK
ncbi:hypothetical protein LCGC14_1139160 [marine sediment metagenome]|uniref:Uncharacterized protein n=1 Tax=marine sediment metagenome TaxID=412755 RepID=A0A0F9Q4J9_9ZZZZ